jgi:hypothetical protein
VIDQSDELREVDLTRLVTVHLRRESRRRGGSERQRREWGGVDQNKELVLVGFRYRHELQKRLELMELFRGREGQRNGVVRGSTEESEQTVSFPLLPVSTRLKISRRLSMLESSRM